MNAFVQLTLQNFSSLPVNFGAKRQRNMPGLAFFTIG